MSLQLEGSHVCKELLQSSVATFGVRDFAHALQHEHGE
jgi:hypothetical protein